MLLVVRMKLHKPRSKTKDIMILKRKKRNFHKTFTDSILKVITVFEYHVLVIQVY